MLPVSGETESGVIRPATAVAPPFVRGVFLPVALGVGVRLDDGAFCGFGFLDGFFALVQFVDECRLGRLLSCEGGVLGDVNLGRVLWSGQICELQIHWSDRHRPAIHPVASVLL